MKALPILAVTALISLPMLAHATQQPSPSATAGAGAESASSSNAAAHQGQAQGQGQLQGQAQGQITAVRTTAELNNASAAGSLSTGGTANGGTGNTETSVEGDNIDGSFGFSYYDAEAALPQAAIGDGTVVTSYRIKLGPIFGWSDQVVHYLPAVVSQYANSIMLARGVDVTNPHPNDVAMAYSAALCLFVPEVKGASASLTGITCDGAK